jgi:NTP pyrophosphatase (non-canonical NTP hydrolase)
MKNEIKQLMHKVRSFSEERAWTKFHNPKDLAIALVLEANEVLEPFRFKDDFKYEDVAKEVVDVLNIVLRLSDILKIDLVYWFNKKMKENEFKYPINKFYGKNLKYSEEDKNALMQR